MPKRSRAECSVDRFLRIAMSSDDSDDDSGDDSGDDSILGVDDDSGDGSDDVSDDDSESREPHEDPDAFPYHWHQTKKNGKIVQVLTSRVDAKGGLWGGCDNTCKHQDVDMAMFAPAESTQTNGARQTLLAALDAFVEAWKAKDWTEATKQRVIVERLRTKHCNVCCGRKKKLTPVQQACKDEWDRMRQEACRKNDGCCNPECTERGMAAWIAISADHGTNPKRRDLSNYAWWVGHGGVPAMREEATQIYQWPCLCCHMLEPTSSTGKINNPDTMEPKPNETEQEFRDRKSHAAITFPKYEYVNTLKRAIGACQYPGCGRKVVNGNESSFHFDHRVESTKRKCRCLNDEGEPKGGCHGCADSEFKRTGGVGGLAHNAAQATALEYADAKKTIPTGRIKKLIDTEAAPKTCDLFCANCHFCRKPHGIARHEEFVRPAPPPRRQLLMDDANVKKRARRAAKAAAKRKRDAVKEEAPNGAVQGAGGEDPPLDSLGVCFFKLH